jgi:hypothetical protein
MTAGTMDVQLEAKGGDLGEEKGRSMATLNAMLAVET